MTTTPKTLPDGIRIDTLAKWLDPTKEHGPRICFKLRIIGPHGFMDTDYSGGLLAFPNWTHARHRDTVLRAAKYVHEKQKYDIAVSELFRTAKPDPLDVMQSLILDMDAGAQSFPEFCGEFGYDEDSRKAFATWETCNRNGAEFRKIMGAHLDTLRDLTENL